ncbi:MAG: methionine adenosyltransferase domain-containing protein [Hyphomonas sp.]
MTEAIDHTFKPADMIETGRHLEGTALLRAVKAHAEHRIFSHSGRTVVFARQFSQEEFHMKLASHEFTSESVSEGHPDKVADQISDAIVDLFLSKDPTAKVAVETLTTTNRVVLAGEVRTNNGAVVTPEEMNQAARDVVRKIGYEQDGFHWERMVVENHVHGQSAEIAQGVEEGQGLFKEEGAGDQGIMFGYATNETPELMPATLLYSHQILEKLAALRHSGKCPQLEPDAKSQVTLRREGSKPVGVNAVVVSHQHGRDVSQDELREIIRPVARGSPARGLVPTGKPVLVNPTGSFYIGAGLTATRPDRPQDHRRHLWRCRPHGGGAFSGKDPSKVDRSAAYATRYLAKHRRLDLPNAARSRSAMPSASQNRCRSMSTRMTPATPTNPASPPPSASCST